VTSHETASDLRLPKTHPGRSRGMLILMRDAAEPIAAAYVQAGCGVPILSQARDLGIVRGLPGDGVLKMNAFK
jgi:hypothetical protein